MSAVLAILLWLLLIVLIALVIDIRIEVKKTGKSVREVLAGTFERWTH